MRHLSNALVAVYIFINACEWYYLSAEDGLRPMIGKNAVELRLRDRGWPKGAAQLYSRAASRLGTRTISVVMGLVGIVLFVTGLLSLSSPIVSVAALLVVVVFNATLAMGLEGADQMAVLVLFSNAVSSLVPDLQVVAEYFVLAQLVLSYGVAGLAKLFSSHWRSGRALSMILSTRSFGVGSVPFLARSQLVAGAMCSFIIAYEMSWFVAPFNLSFALILMLVGVVFHLGNSWLMGLNLFPWSFLSAYPIAISGLHRLHT